MSFGVVLELLYVSENILNSFLYVLYAILFIACKFYNAEIDSLVS